MRWRDLCGPSSLVTGRTARPRQGVQTALNLHVRKHAAPTAEDQCATHCSSQAAASRRADGASAGPAHGPGRAVRVPCRLAQTRWLTGGSGHSDLGAAPSRIRDQAVHDHITRAALSSRRRTVGISHGGSQSRNLHPCTYSVTSWLFVGDSAYYCTLVHFATSNLQPRCLFETAPPPCSETLPSVAKRRSIGRLRLAFQARQLTVFIIGDGSELFLKWESIC